MTAEYFPVEASHIMMFARAIGDTNPAFSDVGQPEAMIAPPTFPMAAAQFDPANPLIPKPDEPWFGSASGPGFSRGGGGGGLHAEQIFEYHRPLRAGDVLSGTSSEARNWEKQSRRGGLLKFTEHVVDYHDQLGELVVSVTMVAVVPEHPVAKQV